VTLEDEDEVSGSDDDIYYDDDQGLNLKAIPIFPIHFVAGIAFVGMAFVVVFISSRESTYGRYEAYGRYEVIP
jgi:hypothetical protein